jgi:uncharacterized membrane protein YqjE
MPIPAPAPADSVASPSLFHSVRTFWRVLIAILYTRLDLFTTELGEEAFRILYMAVAGVVALMCLHCAFFFLLLWILAAFWDTAYRLYVIGGIFVIYLAIGGACLLYVVNTLRNRPRFLGQTLAELRRDAEGLKSPFLTPESKP